MKNLFYNISRFMLEKKYLSFVIALIVVILGLIAFKHLDFEAYPDLSPPTVQIVTLMQGKGAEDIERLVTIPLEKELNGLPKAERIDSVSFFGLSQINVIFKEDVNTDLIRPMVIERMLQADLSDEAEPSLSPDTPGIGELYRYTLESDYYSKMTLKAIQSWDLERAFRQVAGVIDVSSFGGPVRTYSVHANMEKLKYYGLNIQDIYDVIETSNSTVGGHYIGVNSQAFTVRGMGLLQNEKDIENIVIKEVNGVPIKIKNLATVSIEPAVRLGQVGKDFDDDVIQGIVLMKKGENPSKVMKNIYNKLDSIRAELPKGIHLKPFYDRTELVNQTLHTIGHNVFLGIIFVVIVLFAYTLNLRITLIASCVIPLSILFAFIFFKIFNIPVNFLSLGAVDFGIVVDGAIIVSENIFRHLTSIWKTGESKKDVILRATNEVFGVVIYSTTIIILCFLVLFIFDSVAGILFRPLAFTMGYTLIGAFLFAFLIIPSLFLMFFPEDTKIKNNNALEKINHAYMKSLNFCMRNAKKFLIGVAVLTILSVILSLKIGSEFMPSLDEGSIWLQVNVIPRNVTIEHSVEIARKIRLALLEYPEVGTVVSQVGADDAGMDPCLLSGMEFFVTLKPAREWRGKYHRNKENIIKDMDEKLKNIPGINTFFTQAIQNMVDLTVSGAKGEAVLKIYGTSLEELQRLQDEAITIIKEVHGPVDLWADRALGQPQYQLKIDRDKIARYGLSNDDVQRIIETAIGGNVSTEIIKGEKKYPVFVRLDEKDRDTLDKLGNIFVQTPDGKNIPLKNLTNIETNDGAMYITRVNDKRCSIIRFNVRGRDLGTTVREVRSKIQKQLVLPEAYSVEWSGQAQSQDRANVRLVIIFPLIIILIAGLLYMLFRNKYDVIISLLTLSTVFIGAVFALFITGTYFSISAGVGFIAALGVSIQNCVILISEMHLLEKKYTSIIRRVIQASITKLRPRLMTSTVAILGLLPASMSNGIGAQSQKPFAITIIGALSTGTLISIFFIPVLYYYFEKRREAKKIKCLKN